MVEQGETEDCTIRPFSLTSLSAWTEDASFGLIRSSGSVSNTPPRLSLSLPRSNIGWTDYRVALTDHCVLIVATSFAAVLGCVIGKRLACRRATAALKAENDKLRRQLANLRSGLDNAVALGGQATEQAHPALLAPSTQAKGGGEDTMSENNEMMRNMMSENNEMMRTMMAENKAMMNKMIAELSNKQQNTTPRLTQTTTP